MESEEAREKLTRLQLLAAEIAAAVEPQLEQDVSEEQAIERRRPPGCKAGFFCGVYNCTPPFSCSTFRCSKGSAFTFGLEAQVSQG